MKTSSALTFLAAATIFFLPACSGNNVADEWNSETSADLSRELEPEGYSDLRMFELQGPVKECVKQTFYSVKMQADTFAVDTMPETIHRSELYFDKLGNYVPSSNERIDRDDKGRITYWRDSRPNAKGVDPGMLRDTLRYTHINNNVLQSKGMGEFAITVYDNEGRIVGQYSDPDVKGTQTAAFNVYRSFDSMGNWTERLTVWTTQSAGGRPHVSYTVDRRTVTYYQD